MERLTKRYTGGISNNDRQGFTCSNYCDNCRKADCNTVKRMIRKLADYEDAEEQGVLIHLPCRDFLDIIFGDQTVFWGIDTTYLENPIREITVDNSERITWYDGWKSVVINGSDENGFDWEFKPEDIGNTVFLTREEAVRKFKETNGGKIK